MRSLKPLTASRRERQIPSCEYSVQTHLRPALRVLADVFLRAFRRSSASVYVFDDAYPGIPANDTQPAKHPLSLFSIDALHPIAPSIYSWPALEALSRRSRSIAPITAQRTIPSYFFGISALPTVDPLLPEEETSSGEPKKLDGGKDGVAGIPYVRVGFAFKPLPKISSGEVEDEDGEEGGREGEGDATPRKGSPKEKKGRNARRKSTAKDSARKVWPLVRVAFVSLAHTRTSAWGLLKLTVYALCI